MGDETEQFKRRKPWWQQPWVLIVGTIFGGAISTGVVTLLQHAEAVWEEPANRQHHDKITDSRIARIEMALHVYDPIPFSSEMTNYPDIMAESRQQTNIVIDP